MKNILKPKKEESYKIKDLYVGQIVYTLGEKFDKKTKTSTRLTMQAQKAAILTPVEPYIYENIKFSPIGYKSLSTNKVLRPIYSTNLGLSALNDITLKSFKDYFPELMEKYNLTEDSELTLKQLIKLEDQEKRRSFTKEEFTL